MHALSGLIPAQEDDFDEDEGIYEDLNLDEVEGAFGFAAEDENSDDSDGASEGISRLMLLVLSLGLQASHRHPATTNKANEEAARGRIPVEPQTRRQPYTEESISSQK